MSAAYGARFASGSSIVGEDDADLEAEEAVDLAHPLGVALGEVVVDGDEVHALAGERVEVGGQRETRVLPSPVFISATQPKCSAAPPMIWTSKWRWPSVRLPASRTAANASGRRSSRCSLLLVVVVDLVELLAERSR